MIDLGRLVGDGFLFLTVYVLSYCIEYRSDVIDGATFGMVTTESPKVAPSMKSQRYPIEYDNTDTIR